MTERELFLYNIDGLGYIFDNKKWLGNCFEDAMLNMAWEVWVTSANREGFKLVNINMTEDQLSMSYEFDECVTHGDRKEVYKAMIGACDENN